VKPTLRQMQYLVAIADTGTFSEAAKRTFVSQPSLSAQIKDMEAHIGMPLLERGRHGAIVLPTVGPYLLPQVTRRLHAQYPDLRLSVREEGAARLQDHLAGGQFDMIISGADDHPDTISLPIVSENIYICIAPDDALAGSRDPVKLSELKGREFLTLGHADSFTLAVRNLAARAGATTQGEYEGTSLDAIRQMASMGGGVAILPSLYAISEAKRDPQLIVRPINHPLAQRQISLIWRQTSPMGSKFNKIGDIFEQTAQAIMS